MDFDEYVQRVRHDLAGKHEKQAGFLSRGADDLLNGRLSAGSSQVGESVGFYSRLGLKELTHTERERQSHL